MPTSDCADSPFTLAAAQADICQLGMDQRKVNMLAREYCDVAEPKIKFKPVILSHRECGRGRGRRRRLRHARSVMMKRDSVFNLICGLDDSTRTSYSF